MSDRKPIWPVLLAAAIGLAILLSLGVWQVKRLAWKEGLIAQLEANAAGDPVDVGLASDRLAAGDNIEFLKVSLSGTFAHPSEAAILTTFERGPGFTIVTPLEMADGTLVLVDRGQVPESGRDAIERPEGPQVLTGIVRMHEERQGFFDVADETQGRTFYWWDKPSIQAQANLPQARTWLPFVVQLLPEAGATTFPRPPQPKADLRNNHLGYAITWFGLAAVLMVMTGVYVRGQMKKTAA